MERYLIMLAVVLALLALWWTASLSKRVSALAGGGRVASPEPSPVEPETRGAGETPPRIMTNAAPIGLGEVADVSFEG